MLFPMYTVAAETLLRMTAIQPHELKAGENPRSSSNFTGTLSTGPETVCTESWKHLNFSAYCILIA